MRPAKRVDVSKAKADSPSLCFGCDLTNAWFEIGGVESSVMSSAGDGISKGVVQPWRSAPSDGTLSFGGTKDGGGIT